MSHSFLLDSVEIESENIGDSHISLLSPSATIDHTHISLVFGANGTSKSRILACIVEQLCEIQEKSRLRPTNSWLINTPWNHGLRCLALTTSANGMKNEYSFKKSSDHNLSLPSNKFSLPSRILVISNLVVDKFQFSKADDENSGFYHYLGVRQGTNMMTSGSMDRAFSEAVLSIAPDIDQLKSLQEWVRLIFPIGGSLAFQFTRLSLTLIQKYLESNNKREFLSERMQRRIGNRRSIENTKFSLEDTEAKVTRLFDFLKSKAAHHDDGLKQSTPDLIIKPADLTLNDRVFVSEIRPLLEAASRAGYSAWPSVSFESNNWIQFNQLSSGEQNLLSVGAKLIAHARPGCFIAIDEPEVSLNVVWQQQYIDLVLKSLKNAPRSHVVIATHSPHLISSIPSGQGSVVVIEKEKNNLSFNTINASFEGWGSEAILYEVSGIPSTSNFLLTRELANVLKHIQDGGSDKVLIGKFLKRVEKLDFGGIEPLQVVVEEIKKYSSGL